MSYNPNSLPVGGNDAVDYWSLGWDDATKVEGGIHAFDDVLSPDKAKIVKGIIPVDMGPKTELPGGIIEQENDEDTVPS